MTIDQESAIPSTLSLGARRALPLLFVLSALVGPAAVDGQSLRGASQVGHHGNGDSTAGLVLYAGATSYDLSGVGTSGVAAARVEWPLSHAVTLEAGSGFFWYAAQTDQQVAMLLPEAGILARLPGPVPLRLGAGIGHTLGVKGTMDDDLTLFGALGLVFEDRGGWTVLPEVRIRVVDPWVGTMADFTLGVRRSFTHP